MKDDTLHNEDRNKRNGFYLSLGLHLALFLLFFIPFMKMISFPPEDSGLMVVFGEPEAGLNDNMENAPEETNVTVQTAEPKSSTKDDVVSKTREDVAEVSAKEVKKKSSASNTEAEKKEKLERERAAREQKEREAKEKEASEKKKKISDLFGKGSGNGQSRGNEGAQNGEPNGKVLDGITKGSGRVGGGLSSRGLLHEPAFKDNSQRSGRVVLTICVDKSGKVISSKFTQKGSTTSDPYLIQITEKAAANYKFTSSDIDSQCGTITVDYKVQ